MENILPSILNIAKFAGLLGILIFVHELGHFLAARRFGVYVKKFYLGFDIAGLKLFRYRGRETEYGIGVLPLGGYVKMAGQEDLPSVDEEGREKLAAEEKDIPPQRRFDRKPLLQRAAIVAAGPLMNLLLGVVLFILIAWIGIRTPLYLSEPGVGLVEKGLPADRAGIRPGDIIRQVDGREIKDWEDLRRKLRATRAGADLPIVLERDGVRQTVSAVPERLSGAGFSQIGIAPAGKVVIRGLLPDSAADLAGIERGDVLLSVNGQPVLAPALGDLLGDFQGDFIPVEVFRPATGESLTIPVPAEFPSFIPGLYLDGDRVLLVDHRAGEEVAKLKKGDRVVEINGYPVAPEEVLDRIQDAAAGEELALTVYRQGWFAFKPAARITVSAPISARAAIPGVYLDYDDEMILTRYSGLAAVPAGIRLGIEKAGEVMEVFFLLFTGRIGGSAVGGPVMIFQVTSYVHGFSEFLVLLALISINLGLINILPLPVLDGGHLLFFALEGVIRRPLPDRVLLISQQIGLAVIAVLIVLITYKDILRVLGY